MRRLRWFALLCLFGGVARGQVSSYQEWTDNQNGMSAFAAFGVTSYSATNLALGGAAYSVFGTGQIVNSPQAIATAWYVDPVNGSDVASCVTSATACKTLQEINRRWRGGRIDLATTVNILGPLPSTDTGSWNVTIAQGIRVLFLGSLGPVTGFGGAAIDNTLHTGTVTAFTAATDAPSATDSEMTDSAIPTSFTASGLLASGIIFSDTTANKQFYAAKDLGSKTIRVTPPMLNPAPQLSSALTVGDTYKAYQLWTIYGQDFGAAASRVRFDTLNDQAGPLGQSPGTSNEHFRCWYLLSNSIKSIALQLVNCALDMSAGSGFLSSAYNAQGFASIAGGMLLGNGATDLSIQGRVEISGLIMQGAAMRPDEGFLTFPGGSIGVYDLTVPAFTLHGPSSLAFVQSSVGSGNGLCGKNNTSKLVTFESGPSFVYYGYQSHLPPFSAATTSDATPIQNGLTSYPISSLPAFIDTSINFETNFPSTVYETGGPARLTWASVPNGDCVARDGGALIGVPCGSGAGGSSGTTVTGVAPIRVDAGAVALVGGYVSGSTSTTAQNLSAQASGYVKDDKDGGVAQLYTVATIPASDITGLPDASTQRLSAGPGITIDASVIINNLTTGTPDGGSANPVVGGSSSGKNLLVESNTSNNGLVIIKNPAGGPMLEVNQGTNPGIYVTDLATLPSYLPNPNFTFSVSGNASDYVGLDFNAHHSGAVPFITLRTADVQQYTMTIDAGFLAGNTMNFRTTNALGASSLALWGENTAEFGTGLTTSSAAGWLRIPSMAGVPTGVPNSTGHNTAPMVYDRTDNRLYEYNGGALPIGQYDGALSGAPCVIQTNTSGIHSCATVGAGTVTSVTGTAGQILCTPSSPNPVCSLIATAVTPGSYTNGSFTVDGLGRLTAASSGTAPVTSVTGTAGHISVSPTTVSPVVDLVATAVTPGSYTLASLTVDADGRITAASNGSAGSGTVTSVTATVPIVCTPSSPNPVCSLQFDNSSITLNGGNAIQVAAFTHDVTTTAGSTTANVVAMESTAVARGDVIMTSFVAPSAPAGGTLACYMDSGTATFTCEDATAATQNTVHPGNCTTSNWVTGYSTSGARTCLQPTYADIGGTPPATTCGGLPALTGPDGIATTGATCTVTNAFKGKVQVSGTDTPDYISAKIVSQTGSIAVTSISGGSLLSVDVVTAPVPMYFSANYATALSWTGVVSYVPEGGVLSPTSPLANEYPIGPRSTVTLKTNAISVSCGSGSIKVTVFKNGSATAVVGTMNCAATGVTTTGPTALSVGATDTIGLVLDTTGASSLGGGMQFTAVLVLQ